MTWRERAACRPDRDWFPNEHNAEAVEALRAICGPCPVRRECLEDALAVPPTNDPAGIRGGTTATERRQIRRERKTAA